MHLGPNADMLRYPEKYLVKDRHHMERDRALTQDSSLLQPKQKQETGMQLRFSTEIIKKKSFRL